MSQCNCEICQRGRKLTLLTKKYKMSKTDSQYLLNPVFKLNAGFETKVLVTQKVEK